MIKTVVQYLFCVCLMYSIQVFAQQNSNAATDSTKPVTAKSLNQFEFENIYQKLELEKTQTITPVFSDSLKTKKDSIISTSTIKISKTSIVIKKNDTTKTITTTKVDSQIVKTVISQSDTIINHTNTSVLQMDSSITILPESDSLFPKSTLISTRDTAEIRKYTKAELLADSIRNANKDWLDSTLSALPKSIPVIINPNDEIEIFISGGGLYAGVNPTLYDRLTIFHTGLVRRESKTKLQGEQIVEKKISTTELTKLAQYIIDQGFFEFNYLYDCHPLDKECNTRLNMEPLPTPLSLSVAIGQRRNKIYVTLYAPKLESNWVNFPKNLEKIVDAIYSVVF